MVGAASKLLLLVEDEALICDALTDALESEGFDVAVARDGAAALILLNRYQRELAGLITDIDLGSSTNGWLVAKTAREFREDLPVFYISGASARDWPQMSVANSVMFPKPFRFERFASTVAAAILPRSSA